MLKIDRVLIAGMHMQCNFFSEALHTFKGVKSHLVTWTVSFIYFLFLMQTSRSVGKP